MSGRTGRTAVGDMKWTKGDFLRECREILASEILTESEKARRVRRAAELYVDWRSEAFPEVRALRRREKAFERLHAPSVDQHVFCPECGWWIGDPPAEVKCFEGEFYEIMRQKANELVRSCEAREG